MLSSYRVQFVSFVHNVGVEIFLVDFHHAVSSLDVLVASNVRLSLGTRCRAPLSYEGRTIIGYDDVDTPADFDVF